MSHPTRPRAGVPSFISHFPLPTTIRRTTANPSPKLWGSRILNAPLADDLHTPSTASEYTPVILATTFPSVHPQPFQQGATLYDQTGTSYDRWLLSPLGACYNTRTAIPVRWYAQFLTNDFWAVEWPKYMHHTLQLTHHGAGAVVDGATPRQPLKTELDMFTLGGGFANAKTLIGTEAHKWVIGTARRQLIRRGHLIIVAYLELMHTQIAGSRLLISSLEHEQKSWARKSAAIAALGTQAADEWNVAAQEVRGNIAPMAQLMTAATAVATINGMSDRIDASLQRMMVLVRTVDQELAYQQNVLAIATQIGPESAIPAYRDWDRIAVYDTAMRDLRTCIARAVTTLQTVQAGFTPITAVARQSDFSWESMLEAKVDAIYPEAVYPQLPDNVAGAQSGFEYWVDELRTMDERFKAQITLLNDTRELLGNMVDQPSDDWRFSGRGLHAITRSQQRRFISHRAMAQREIRRIADRPTRRLIREWMRVLARHVDDSGLGEMAAVIGDQERRDELVADAHFLLDNEKTILQDRRANANAGLTGPVNEVAVNVLLLKILNLAGNDAGDRAHLLGIWTPEAIRLYMNDQGRALAPIPVRQPSGLRRLFSGRRPR